MTAVEWLLENSHIVPKNELNKRELIEQAKEMEKQQQGYSEEEVLFFIREALYDTDMRYDRISVEDWFEHLKYF